MSLYVPANEPFTSNTGQFTQTSYNGDPTGTLTISGGVGTCNPQGGGSYSSAWYLDTNFACTVPSIWSSIDIVSLPFTSGSYLTVDVGIMKSDGHNELVWETGTTGGSSSGGYTLYDIDSSSKNTPTMTFLSANPDPRGIPQAIGLRLINRQVQGWVKYAGVWELKAYGVTTLDYTATGALSGYYGGFNTWANPSTYTVVVDNLQFGLGYDPSLHYQAVILGDSPLAFVPGNEYTGTNALYIADVINGFGNGWTGAGTELAIPGSSNLSGLGSRSVEIDSSTGRGGLAFNSTVYTTNPSQLSMEMWINSTQTLSSAYGMVSECAGVFSDVSGVVATDWGMGLSGNMQVSIGWGSPSGDQGFVSSQSNNDGNWHYLAATLDVTTGNYALYVDGVLSTSGTGATAGPRYGQPFWWSGSNAQNLQALVSNLAIYNYVLTPTQVHDHFIAGFFGTQTIGVAFD